MTDEIAEGLRRIDAPQKGGVISVLTLPRYVVAMHVAETAGFGGSCDVLGFPGSVDEKGIELPNDRIRVELVMPRTFNGQKPMTPDVFWAKVDDLIDRLERPTEGDPPISATLRTAYDQAKQG